MRRFAAAAPQIPADFLVEATQSQTDYRFPFNKLQSGGHFAPTHSAQGVRMAIQDRGFASMDRTKQREIASKGGRAAHTRGTAHEWTSEEAREAGRKGGLAGRRARSEQVVAQASSEPESMSSDSSIDGSTER